MSDFGVTFTNAREAKGLALEQIAAETRIGARFLEAIENEDFSQLPKGVFSRGFVRSYAEFLGLDTAKAVADFERLSNYREPTVMEGLRVSVPQPDKVNRTLYPVAIGALIVLVIVVYFATRDTTTAVTAGTPPPAVTTPPLAPAAAPEPTPVQPPAPTAPAVEAALVVELEATEPSWIQVTLDGKLENMGEILRNGTTRKYSAGRSIGLIVGNAGGFTLRINGRKVPSLGPTGKVRIIDITTQNQRTIG